VSDPASCNLSDTATRQLLVMANGGANDSIPTVNVCGGPAQIGIVPVYDTAVSYFWYPASGLDQTNIADPFCSDTQFATYHLIVARDGCSDTLAQKVDCIITPSGLNDILPGPGFEVYPNPAHNRLRIKLTGSTTADSQVEILNVCGQIVEKSTAGPGRQELEMDISNMASGIYFVRMTGNNLRFSLKKLIKL
jgi:hypothetical protein